MRLKSVTGKTPFDLFLVSTLNTEKKPPQTDDFAIKKMSGCEGKILIRHFNTSRNAKFFTSVLGDTLTKIF